MGHRWAAALLLLAVTAGLLAGLTRFAFDNSYTQWFVEGDPALVAYDDFIERFGSDEAIFIGLDTAGDPLSAETLAIVQGISARFLDHPEVARVWSLTHASTLRNTGAGLEVRQLIEDVPPPAEERAWLEAELEHGAVASLLVTPDRATTLISLILEPTDDQSVETKMELVRTVRAGLGELDGGRTTWLSGGTVVDEALFRYSAEDSALFAPIMFGALLLVLALLFRSVAGVVLPLLVVAVSVLWSFGFLSWLGWKTNIVTTILPPIIMAVGIADSVHLLQQLRLAFRKGLDRTAALKSAYLHVLRPCLLTTLTTAAGMASLSAAKLSGIRELGLTAAVGVIAAFVLTMVAMPLVLAITPDWALGGLRTPKQDAPVPASLVAVARFSVRNRVPVALGAAALVGLALAGLPRLTVGASMTSYFWDDDPIYQQGLEIDRAFGGSLPAELLVEAIGDSTLLEPEALAKIDEVARYIATVDATGTPISAVDFLQEARRVLRSQPHGTKELPATRAEAAQILLMMEGDAEVERYLTFDRRSARVSVPVELGRYEEIVDRLPEIEAELDRIGGDVVNARVTGLARLMGGMEEYLVDSQITTFALAFVLVLGCIAVMFRSWRAGLLSAVPNLFPLVLVLGLMGWTGISLDLTTIMIAPRVPSRHRASVMAASNVVTTITVANHFGKTEVPVRVMLANEVPASQKMHSHFVVDLLLNALLRGYLRARACGHTLRGAGSLDGFPELKLLCDLDAAARVDMPTEHRPDTLFRCAGGVVAGCACCGTRCDCVVWPWVLRRQRTCGVPERPATRAHHAAAHA